MKNCIKLNENFFIIKMINNLFRFKNLITVDFHYPWDEVVLHEFVKNSLILIAIPIRPDLIEFQIKHPLSSVYSS